MWLVPVACCTALSPAIVSGAEIRGKVVFDGPGDSATPVIVSAEPAGAAGAERAPVRGHRIEVNDAQVQPRLVVARPGDHAMFVNGDPMYHRLFWRDSRGAHSVHLGKSGTDDAHQSITLHEPGALHIFCLMHPKMQVRIQVVDAPRVQVVIGEGRFEFLNVANGQWRLRAMAIGGGLTDLETPARDATSYVVLRLQPAPRPTSDGRSPGTNAPDIDALFPRGDAPRQ